MMSCEVICDLMVAYQSGEASQETRRLVEAHLASCPACRAAFAAGNEVDASLRSLGRAEHHGNGGQFISRTRQRVFAVGAFILSCFVGVLSILTWQLRTSFGARGDLSWLVLLALAAFMPAFYYILTRRRASSATRSAALAGSIPLIVLAVACIGIAGAAPWYGIGLGLVLLGVTLAFVYQRLPRVPHMAIAAGAVLLLLNAALFAQLLVMTVQQADDSFETAAMLGRPAEGTLAEDAVSADLAGLGLQLDRVESVREINGVSFAGETFQVASAVYRSEGGAVRVTAAAFHSRQSAERFFDQWSRKVSGGVQLARVRMSLPALGQSLRTYNVARGAAYYGWQEGPWVTTIDVLGPFRSANSLAHAVQRLVSAQYHGE